MPTITFHHLGYITEIDAGATHQLHWNNAAAQRVWCFSVDAHVLPPFPGPAKVEVTRVEYRQTSFDGEREIHFWIKNTGSFRASYAIHMATIRE